MKKFLRDRKNSQSKHSKPLVSAPASLAPPASAETPLYARFARNQDGSSKPIVSEPARLSSKISFSRGSTHSGKSGGGQDRQSKVLSRMPSRQDQVQSKPNMLSSPPTRSSSRVAPPPKTEPLPVPAHVSGTAFPRMSSYESPRPGQTWYSQSPSTHASSSRVQLPATRDRTDSSGSESYAPPPRPLVVRNGDPEILSTASLTESSLSKTQPPPPAPTLPASPPMQYGRLHQTGFALHDPRAQPHHTSSQQSPLHNNAGASRSRYPAVEPPSSTSYTPNRPAYTQHAASESQAESSVPSILHQPPQRATSLLATPSVTRKKYSPLAAFGLPVSPTASMTPSSSMQPEPVSSV